MDRCDGRVIHLGDLDVFFVLINLFSKFLLQLECCYKREKMVKLLYSGSNVHSYWSFYRFLCPFVTCKIWFSSARNNFTMSMDYDEIIYYDINIYYTGPLPLALNSYFIGIDIFIYSIYPV
jgi:hypothetical protein